MSIQTRLDRMKLDEQIITAPPEKTPQYTQRDRPEVWRKGSEYGGASADHIKAFAACGVFILVTLPLIAGIIAHP